MKERIDQLLVRRGFFSSREQARRSLLAGEVFVAGRIVDKAGALVDEEEEIHVTAAPPYVSRGGLKLEKALDTFGLSPSGMVVLDVGASTGGFTDCLLQRGAQRVYAIDVGRGQLAWTLRQDPRVVVMERTNVRNLTPADLPEKGDLATIDVSFISVTKFLHSLLGLLTPQAGIILLIKPQFEAGREKVGKKGVVRDPQVHLEVIETILSKGQEVGLIPQGLTYSPIRGPQGNIEYLLHWGREQSVPIDPVTVVTQAHNDVE